MVVGNPPYGNAGNQAIAFINACGDMCDDIRMVLPVSVRKASSMNKIRLDFKCIEDKDLPLDTFPRGIRVCYQRWVKTDILRTKTKLQHTHDDFEFVKVGSGDADVMIGRTGLAGQVKTTDFTKYCDDHFFLKVKSPEVTKRLVSLEPIFLEIASDCNGRSHLSKHELITTYINTSLP